MHACQLLDLPDDVVEDLSSFFQESCGELITAQIGLLPGQLLRAAPDVETGRPVRRLWKSRSVVAFRNGLRSMQGLPQCRGTGGSSAMGRGGGGLVQ